MKIHVIDLQFHTDESIAAFLIETTDGPVLIETGPITTWQHLEKGILDLGFQLTEIKHVLLTHIHFDHAGAAWKLAEYGATIYVHPIGLPHLENPEKLWNSAKMIYKDQMEPLWGEMKPIPAAQLKPLDDGDQITIGDATFITHYTPGHAVHHNAYQLGDVVFTGDVAGVKIENGPIQPPCPPPDINIELWFASIDKINALNPTALYLTHFGRQENVPAHLATLKSVLQDWSEWIRPHFEQDESPESVTPLFEKYISDKMRSEGITEHELEQYHYANPVYMSVTGLYRYWKLKSQGRI